MKQVLLIILTLCFSATFGQNLPNVQPQAPAIGVNALGDYFFHDPHHPGHYSLGWYLDSWNPGGLTGYLSGFSGLKFFTLGRLAMSIHANGNVGIGTANPVSMLSVAGDITAREIKVTVNAGADYVFDKDYRLRSLSEVESFIAVNKHLPEIEPASKMESEGIGVSEMNIKLLQKIEELTLYLIDQKKDIERLKESNAKLAQVIEKRL
ncbi:hypothetical protein B0I27_11639 [Arcticibacter pallidicorallinus]|uniref:Uncharacterized protein n=1 Tax=Arcticibacter pallidicorallinus TaxID=1259464 RepID=A0A2T0TQZ9_9SPHI|nr:hypothetical protein [Arcticibacter pallidicorallinus]PRY48105.1 hypothetical protein B0I27_11639 [Arcticibacter pallidicorallinus]